MRKEKMTFKSASFWSSVNVALFVFHMWLGEHNLFGVLLMSFFAFGAVRSGFDAIRAAINEKWTPDSEG